jgi:hypothetical protein
MEKVPVSERALFQRINRTLKKQGEILRKSKRQDWEIGEFYLLDLQHNVIIGKDLDLEELGRRLDVLKPYEVLEVRP